MTGSIEPSSLFLLPETLHLAFQNWLKSRMILHLRMNLDQYQKQGNILPEKVSETYIIYVLYYISSSLKNKVIL